MAKKHLFNRINMTKNYLSKKNHLDSFPVEFIIESTNRCNLRCTMCAINRMKRKVGDIDFEKFKTIIDEIKDYAELVFLHGLGEPLLHPRIVDMVEYCSRFNLKTGISTNATLLHKEMSKNLLGAGLDYMILAFDGATKETFERIRKNANYEQVCENIKTFLKVKHELHNTNFTIIQMVLTDETETEIKAFLSKWKKEKGIDALRLKREIDYRFTKEKNDKKRVCNKPCFSLWRQGSICWDGTVPLCCMVTDREEVIGNVFKEGSFFKVWNSERMKEIRKLHSEGKTADVSICRRCDIPQPSYLGIFGLTLFDAYRTRKILPFIEGVKLFGDFR